MRGDDPAGDLAGGASTSSLLEREAELTMVEEALLDAKAGEGRLLLIQGPPGIGKTELIAATARSATSDGWRALIARGGELERDFAFGLVRDLFRGELATLPESDRAELFSGTASLALPVLEDRPPGYGGRGRGTELQPLLEGLHWMTVNLARRAPLALLIDDAHWADAQSLAFASYLARRLAGERILLVLAARGYEQGPGELETLRDLTTTELAPAPLSPAAAGRLLEEHLGTEADEAFASACHRATGGNPFLLAELARELAAEGVEAGEDAVRAVEQTRPGRAVASILIRLGRLSGDAAALAKAVAVLGDGAEPRVAERLAHVSGDAAVEAESALASAAILRDERPLRFVHPLARASVYDDLPAAERVGLHAHAARILLDEGANAERVASHLLMVEPRTEPRAAAILREAAAGAASRAGEEAAIKYLRRALEEPLDDETRTETLLDLGISEARSGHVEAAQHLTVALSGVGEPQRRAEASRQLAFAQMTALQIEAAAGTLEQAIAELAPRERELALRLEAERLILGYFDLGLRERSAARLASLGDVQAGRTPGERLVLAAAVILRWIATGADDPKGLGELAEAAWGERRLLDDIVYDSPLFYGLVYALIGLERHRLAATALEASLEDGRRRGSRLAFGSTSAARSFLNQHRGRLHDAAADADAAVRVADEIQWAPGIPHVVTGAVVTHAERGEAEAAEAVLRRFGLDGALGREPTLQQVRFARARLRLLQGDPAGALAEGVVARALRMSGPDVYDWTAVASRALSGAGRLEEAREVAERGIATSDPSRLPRASGVALRALAELEPSEAGRIEVLEEAVSVLEGSASRLEHARALIDLGAALRRSNRRADARGPLAEGLELAARSGSGPDIERVLAELAAAGARPRSPQRAGVEALTPSERRICEMAARGMSNPEIAQALFVTRKTVEFHLGGAYRKLEIHSRDELAAALSI